MKKAIVWAGVVSIVLMCFFPPWTSNSGKYFEYHCILSASGYSHIDVARLIIQCVIIGLLTGCIFWTVGKWRENQQSKGIAMNWARGFKRITFLIAIAAAIAGGFFAVAIPINKYYDAQNRRGLDDQFVVCKHSEQEFKDFEKWKKEIGVQSIDKNVLILDAPPAKLINAPNAATLDALWEDDAPPAKLTNTPNVFDQVFDKIKAAKRNSTTIGSKDAECATQPQGLTDEELVASLQQSHDVPVNYDPFESHPSLMEARPYLLERAKLRYWRYMPMPKLVGFCILAGLCGVLAAFAGVWIVVWFGGWAVYKVVRWTVLGFRDGKPK